MNTIRHASRNAWTFLRTEMEPESKPLLLSVADKILYPWTYTQINSEGFPIKKRRKISSNVPSKYSLPKIIDISAFGFGMIAFIFISSPASLLAFTAISFSARIVMEKGETLLKKMPFPLAIISAIALGIFGMVGLMFSYIYLGFTVAIITTLIFDKSNKGPSISQTLILPALAISCLAFNFFVGAVLKFISYKIYPSVQNAYDNFFTLLKAGEKDPRGDNDLALRNSFNNSESTFFNNLPFDILPEIRKFLSSADALQLRSCSKVFFYLTSNQDFLKIRIYENYIFKSATMDETETAIKLREEINKTTHNSLLLLLNTYPLDPRLTGPSLNFIMKEDSKIYWKKTPDNKNEYGKMLKGKPFFTKDLLELKL